MKLRYAALTDVGKKRNLNEDSYLANGTIFAVADGMGGHRAGEVASVIALDALRAGLGRRTKDPAEKRLVDAIKFANKKVREKAIRDRTRFGMGTTLTAAFLHGEKLYIGHVGDSRIYLLRDGKLKKLTNDHSLVAQMVESGQLKPEEAEVHPHKSIITRAIGSEADVEVDILIEDVMDNDRFLLCTDGLTTMLTDDEIAEVLRDIDDLNSACRELVDWANDRGGNDNITVILLESKREPSACFGRLWRTRR
ncbi:MAG: Stp1/IreP family PP2C-type Ser/Thr phosphatase [Actinomycetota bacterium]